MDTNRIEYLTNKMYYDYLEYEEADEYINYIKKIEAENEILKQAVKDTYDSSQDIISELTRENKYLKQINIKST